jgi:citrate lyase subunit beta/citryl-CoA lyase
VRVNELGGPDLLKDLAALVPLNPQGILFPKIRGPEDLDVISHYLDMAEEIGGVHKGSIGVIAICTETPSAVLRMGELVMRRRARLKGLIWGAEDLSSAIGAGDPRAVDGGWRDLYKYARSQCLLAAHALEVAPIDTVFVDFKDPDGCRESSMTARFDGFSGKVAIHPDQVPIINAAFSPSAAELERARKIVAAFDQGLGAIAFEGKMLDVPHLKAAQRILANSIPESMRKS